MRDFYVIYSRPTDYPDAPFALRRHTINGRGARRKVRATDDVWTGADITVLRKHIPREMVRMDRTPDDEPQIVEWWV